MKELIAFGTVVVESRYPFSRVQQKKQKAVEEATGDSTEEARRESIQ